MIAATEIIVEEVVELLKLHYGDRLLKVILYGSYARGDYHADSDIDFLVVLKDEFKLTKELNDLVDLMLDLSLRENIYLSVRPVSDKQYQQKANWLFFENVQKDGLVVYG